jgi:hypothetical protein
VRGRIRQFRHAGLWLAVIGHKPLGQVPNAAAARRGFFFFTRHDTTRHGYSTPRMKGREGGWVNDSEITTGELFFGVSKRWVDGESYSNEQQWNKTTTLRRGGMNE